MSIIDSIKHSANKGIDALTSAKAAYESTCNDFVCMSLSKPLEMMDCKAKIIDSKERIIEFSGLLAHYASVHEPKVFVNISISFRALKCSLLSIVLTSFLQHQCHTPKYLIVFLPCLMECLFSYTAN